MPRASTQAESDMSSCPEKRQFARTGSPSFLSERRMTEPSLQGAAAPQEESRRGIGRRAARPHHLPAAIDQAIQRLGDLYAGPWWGLACAGVLCAALGLLARFALADHLDLQYTFSTFYLTVALAALAGGIVSGAVAGVVSAILVHYWVAPLTSDAGEVSLAIFLTACGVISCIGELLHQAWARIREAEARRAGAEQLRIVNESLRLAIAAGAIGTWDLDLARDVAVGGDNMRAIFGLGPETVIDPQSVNATVVPEDRARMRAAFAKALDPEGDGVYRAEYRIRRANDGKLRWVSVRGQAFFEGKRATRMIGIARDVTDDKAAESALLERARLSEQFASVASAAPGVIFTFRQSADGRGCYPYVSPNVKNALGFDRKDIETDARPMHRRVHKDDRAALAAGLAESGRAMTLWQGSFRYDHPQKGWLWLEAQAAPAREADGGLVWHGYVHDVSERKRSEEALARSEARLRATIDGARDAIITIDQAGVIQSINSAGAKMFGYSRLELPGQKISVLTPGHERAVHDGYIWGYARGGDARIVGNGRETEGRRKDGALFPIELAVTEARYDQERLYVAYVRDLSEQRRIEARLEKLHVDRLALMGGMAAALAHEINQPLAATAAYLRAVRRLLDKPPEERTASVAETADKAADQIMRAGRIVANLRSFVARGEPDKTLVSLRQLIEEAVELTAPTARQAGVSVSVACRAENDSVLADRLQIKQVLVNLLRNAIEAMEGGARRELSISTDACADGALRVDVADTGPGLNAFVKEELFEPFMTTKAKGMGVGLSISRSIIEEHYGRIWAEPNTGGGAVFSFTLPLARVGAD